MRRTSPGRFAIGIAQKAKAPLTQAAILFDDIYLQFSNLEGFRCDKFKIIFPLCDFAV
jgi:hypothetical protein